MSNHSQINENQLSEPLNVVKGSFRRGVIVRIWEQIIVWRERRKAIRELSALSDSLLNDMGIERYQISEVVNQPGRFIKLSSASSDTAKVSQLKKIKQAA